MSPETAFAEGINNLNKGTLREITDKLRVVSDLLTTLNLMSLEPAQVREVNAIRKKVIEAGSSSLKLRNSI